jgi:hypothetical protein
MVEFFAVSRDSLLKGIVDFLEEGSELTNEQDHEIMIVSMLIVVHSLHSVFGDDEIGKYIIGKFQDNIFKMYFFEKNDLEKFKTKFWDRCSEYYEIMDQDNENL